MYTYTYTSNVDLIDLFTLAQTVKYIYNLMKLELIVAKNK